MGGGCSCKSCKRNLMVVRVVRGICCCKRIDCSVFGVVRVVRGIMGGRNMGDWSAVYSCKSCKRNLWLYRN